MKTLMLIDSNAIVHRAYHSIPKTLKNRKGEQTNAVYGFTTTLIKALEDLKPDYVAAAFDVSKATFRREKYAEYKATRVAADQELYDQIPRIKELLKAFDIPIYEKEGYEADDMIGTITSMFEHRRSVIPTEVEESSNLKDLSTLDKSRSRDDKDERIDVYIISGDKDIFQLVDGNIFVYNLKKGLSETQIVDRKVIKDEWNLDPEDFIDLKALAGDPSDNIPGIPGIGPKTAIALLQRFDTLQGIYDAIDKIAKLLYYYIAEEKKSNTTIQQYNNDVNEKIATQLKLKPRIIKLLIEYRDQAFLSQELATIHREVPIDFDLEKAKWGDYNRDGVRALFEELGFRSLLKRFGAAGATEEPKTKQAKEQKEKDKQLKLL